MRYSALDPGGHTGYADYEFDMPKEMGEVIVASNAWSAFEDWIERRRDIDVLIVEGYRNRPVQMTKGHANTWSDNLESQIVGFCRGFCRVCNIELIVQDPSIKPIGYGMAGLKYIKGKPGMHKQDALAHGMYWWMTDGSKRQARTS